MLVITFSLPTGNTVYFLVLELAFTQGRHQLRSPRRGRRHCRFDGPVRHFHPVLSTSCVVEDSRPGDRFQVSLDRGFPCLQLASRSAAPRARQYGQKKILDQHAFRESCSMTKPAGAIFARAVPVHLQGRGGDAVPQIAHNLCALHVECGGCRHFQRPPASFRRLLVQAMFRTRRAKLSGLLRGRPCPLYATIFHAATKDRIIDERMRNEQD